MIPDYSEEEWCVLWDKAKEIRSRLPALKQAAYADLTSRFPEITYKQFHTLRRAYLAGKLPDKLADAVAEYHEHIAELKDEMQTSRVRSDQLLEQKRASETRRLLDPKVDPIPPGGYPKLRDCQIYPLRQDCNYGENATSRWNRCEYMKYDGSCSYNDPNRWKCTAPE